LNFSAGCQLLFGTQLHFKLKFISDFVNSLSYLKPVVVTKLKQLPDYTHNWTHISTSRDQQKFSICFIINNNSNKLHRPNLCFSLRLQLVSAEENLDDFDW